MINRAEKEEGKKTYSNKSTDNRQRGNPPA